MCSLCMKNNIETVQCSNLQRQRPKTWMSHMYSFLQKWTNSSCVVWWNQCSFNFANSFLHHFLFRLRQCNVTLLPKIIDTIRSLHESQDCFSYIENATQIHIMHGMRSTNIPTSPSTCIMSVGQSRITSKSGKRDNSLFPLTPDSNTTCMRFWVRTPSWFLSANKETITKL